MWRDLYIKKYGTLTCPDNIEVECFVSKRNQDMVRSIRHIAIKTCRDLKEILKKKHDVIVSKGSIMKYRPFYVQTATEREKATCLCKVCLNFRLKYKALTKHLKNDVEVTNSISEYFGSGITCSKDINGYYQRK